MKRFREIAKVSCFQFDDTEYQAARRLYMKDFGIQTGVLARVEHIMSSAIFEETLPQVSKKFIRLLTNFLKIVSKKEHLQYM